MMNKILYSMLAVLLLISCKSKNEVNYTMNAATNIQYLWETIDTKYCFVEEKGIDWNKIGEEYKQKSLALSVESLGDKYEESLFELMASMLDSLRDGHVNLYSWWDVSRNNEWFDNYPANFNSNILNSKYLTNYHTAGGLTWQILTIDGDSIGYIYYSSFSNSAGGIAALLATKMVNCKGIILDLRNNGGGDMTNAYTLAAPFFEKDEVVGYWNHKTGPGHYDFSNMEEMTVKAHEKVKWLRPTIVLTNRRSYSATNFFINCMKGHKHIAIIGGKSGGGGGMPMSYEMPCGWTVRFSSIKMYDREKNSIEEGIEPDAIVNMISKDKDDIIERAITTIKKCYEQK